MIWQQKVEELARRHALKETMGGPSGVERQHRQGKLTVRERIDLLTDPGSFDEMGKLQGKATYDEHGALASFTPTSGVRGSRKSQSSFTSGSSSSSGLVKTCRPRSVPLETKDDMIP